MSEHLSWFTIVASGAFALLGVVVAGWLAHLKDVRSHRREQSVRNFEATQQLYVDSLANFEKAIRYTEGLQDYDALSHDLARVNSRLLLVAPKQVTEQCELVSDLLYEWSTAYRQAAPKKAGATGLSIISNQDAPHRKQAAEIYPPLNDAILDLATRMRTHLQALEADGRK